MKKVTATTLLLMALLAPGVSFALPASPSPVQTPAALDYSGFVKCDGVVKTDGSEPGRQQICNFANLMKIINETIQWMFYISIPIATVLFAYAGLLYMTGQKGKIDDAKKIFASVGTGFIIMVVAFFAVRTIVSWLVDDPTVTQFLEK